MKGLHVGTVDVMVYPRYGFGVRYLEVDALMSYATEVERWGGS